MGGMSREEIRDKVADILKRIENNTKGKKNGLEKSSKHPKIKR